MTKLQILGFQDSDLSQSNGGKFLAPINPSSISLSFSTNFNVKEGANVDNPEVQYYGGAPPKLSFDLILDGTGMIADHGGGVKNPAPVDVAKQIEEFKKACYYYISGKHEPPYVKVAWGKTLLKHKKTEFAGRLESLSISYSMFKEDGSPLRAKISASFTGSLNPQTEAKVKSQSSPDLTHLITIKAGDSLPALCKNIYGDAQYCHQVAKINKISNFRKLEPGQVLEFPPLK